MTTLQKTHLRSALITSFWIVILFLLSVSETHAAITESFAPLTTIPGVTDKGPTDLPTYINAIYKFIIAFGALFGVVRIAYAGVKYSLSDIVTDKASAKKDIYGVLLGLAILLIPYIVLNTIYPNLTNLDVLSSGKGMVGLDNAPAGTNGGPTSARWESTTAEQSTTQRSCEGTAGYVWDTSVDPAKCTQVTATNTSTTNTSCSDSKNVYYDPVSKTCKNTSVLTTPDQCTESGGKWTPTSLGGNYCGNPNI